MRHCDTCDDSIEDCYYPDKHSDCPHWKPIKTTSKFVKIVDDRHFWELKTMNTGFDFNIVLRNRLEKIKDVRLLTEILV